MESNTLAKSMLSQAPSHPDFQTRCTSARCASLCLPLMKPACCFGTTKDTRSSNASINTPVSHLISQVSSVIGSCLSCVCLRPLAHTFSLQASPCRTESVHPSTVRGTGGHDFVDCTGGLLLVPLPDT